MHSPSSKGVSFFNFGLYKDAENKKAIRKKVKVLRITLMIGEIQS